MTAAWPIFMKAGGAALIAALARAEAAIDFSDDGVGETEFAAARAAASEITERNTKTYG